MNPELDSRARFEAHWRAVRGAKKAANELRRHPDDPQVYINDSANRHFVTWGEAWQAAIASMTPERAKLERFLNAAAGEGYALDGVDAADLYVALFPAEYEAALGALRDEPGPQDTPKEISQ